MGWDSTIDMTPEQTEMAEVEDFVLKSKVNESTTLVVAIAIYAVMQDLRKGKQIEDDLLKDFIKAALMMHLLAGECGNLEFFLKHLTADSSMKALVNTLPLMRQSAGERVADWGENLMRLSQRIEEIPDASQ